MPNVIQTVTIRSAATHNPIQGAQVFVNGVGRGATSPTGTVILTLESGTTYNLSVKATGFQAYATPGVLANQAAFIVDMEGSAAIGLVSFKLTIYPEQVANGIPLVFDNVGSPVNANYEIGGVVVSGLTAGPQTITGSVAGFSSISATFDVSQARVGTIHLTSADAGFANKQQTAVVQDPSTDSLLPNLTPEDVPEFVAPNTGQGTYFTMTQARMYIGNLFIDELNGLQFALQDNKIPIYGYASRFYDALGQGKSLVQGQFSINFISEGYLYTALQAYQDTITQGEVPVNQVQSDQQKRLTFLVNKLANPDPAWTPNMFAAAKTEVRNLIANLPPAAINAARAGLNTAVRAQNNSILGLAGGDYSNAVYSDVGFDVTVEYTGGGRTIVRRLEDCHLISNESIMDHSGTPILDSYGFIARRLR